MAVQTQPISPGSRISGRFSLLRQVWIYAIAAALIIYVFIFVTQGSNRGFSVLLTTLTFATPLTLGALAGVFSERSGVVNIAIEGMMLFSAFSGVYFSLLSGSIWIGLLSAIITGVVAAAFHALLSVTFKVDQIISGTVINIGALGGTSYLNKEILEPLSQTGSNLPALPVFGVNPFTLGLISVLAILLVPVAHYILFYTTWGLRTRAVGENPKAADTAGINVFFMRYWNVILGGGLAGLGGAYFSMQQAQSFQDQMTAGQGFIALAAMIFGKWTPFGAWGGALLFGFTSALNGVLQNAAPDFAANFRDFIDMLPYVITIIVLAGVVGRSRAPAADGVPYTKS